MEFVIDTHSLHWYLQDSASLSPKAKERISQASLIFIPSIVLMEYLFVAKKKGSLRIFKEFLETLPNERFAIYPLELAIVVQCTDLLQKRTFEMHDLIIVATARSLNIPIITKDEEITKKYKKIIW